jgi:hypothetical protein
MNRSEVLKKQLADYERKVTNLEGIVLKDLQYLEKRKNAKDIVILEGKIQSRLRRLDSYQEEIDSLTAELKEAGEFEYPDYSGNVYVYRLKKQPKQKPLKIQVSEARAKHREETATHKVYSTETTAERKRREAKEAAAQRRVEREAAREVKALQKAQEAAEAAKQRAAEREARAAQREQEVAERRAKVAQQREQAAALKAAEREAVALRKAQEAAERRSKTEADRQAAKAAREATAAAERLAKELRKAEAAAIKKAEQVRVREAARKVRVVKELKPKPQPEPKPRKQSESYEMKLAKKRRDKALSNLKNLDAQMEIERINLERRLIERRERVEAVAHLPTSELGPQKRRTARKDLENVERQLRELPERKKQREERLLELVDLANLDIYELLEKDSQLV